MDDKKAAQLLDNYLNGTCTEEEKNLLERFYLEESARRDLPGDFIDFEIAKIEILGHVLENINEPVPVRYLYTWRKIAAVAAIVLVVLSSVLYLQIKNNPPHNPGSGFASDVKPGGNKAYLTLANGSKIDLNNAANGEIARQTGAKIAKATNGRLVYTVTPPSASTNGAKNHTETEYNTIATPKGGQYLVILPDQSKVWLNASSSIKFPTAFTGNERNVSLTGEAYFEVAKNKTKPFIVDINHTEKIQVLGTHFDVMAYDDESNTSATLLEGSVKVTSNLGTALLKPGQKAILTKASGKVQISPADLEEAVAWKNGYFVFNDENLQSIMRKVSRWYDVDIQYQGNLSDQNFTGVISRFENVSKVLEMLQMTGTIHFQVKERRITVMP